MFTERKHDDSGQELVEYAIVFVVLFLLILGIIEFSIIMFSQNSVTNVAREGARWAVVRRSSPAPATYLPPIGVELAAESCDGAGNAVVVEACSKALALAADRLEITLSRPTRDEISVRAEYTYQPFFGLIDPLLPSGLTLGSQSTMRLE